MKGYLKFLYCFLLAVANGYFFNYLNEKYFHYSSAGNGLTEFSKTAQVLLIVLIAPVVESVLFYLLPHLFLRKIKFTSPILLLLLPALLFSMFHLYHPVYWLMALVGGIIMNWYYLHSSKNPKTSFALLVLLHSAYNVYGLLFVQ